jgi:hypothetical protein
MKFRIFRVEHKVHKYGPFTCYSDHIRDMVAWQQWRNYYIGDNHPSPCMDKLDEDRRIYDWRVWSEWLFGCSNERDVAHWFKPIFALLKEHGWVLNIYEVPSKDVDFGSNQVVFRRDSATLIETRELI